MGFRSMLVTDDVAVEWPTWFREKYADVLWFPEDPGPISSRREMKAYAEPLAGLLEDLPRVIAEQSCGRGLELVVVLLHECGGLTRVEARAEGLRWSEPLGWRATEGVEHSYCYGCSDRDKAE